MILRQGLLAQAADDVGHGDVGVEAGVVRQLRLLEVGAVPDGEDVGETLDLQVGVDLQSSISGHAVSWRHRQR